MNASRSLWADVSWSVWVAWSRAVRRIRRQFGSAADGWDSRGWDTPQGRKSLADALKVSTLARPVVEREAGSDG